MKLVGKGARRAAFADARCCTFDGSKASAHGRERASRRRRARGFWPPPMKTPTLPSSAAIVVTWTNLASSPIAVSRWSSRSFGGVAGALRRWRSGRLRSAICCASELIEATEVRRSCADAGLQIDRAGRRRRESARRARRARPSTTWRADEILRLVRDVDEGVEQLLRGVAEAGLAGREQRSRAAAAGVCAPRRRRRASARSPPRASGSRCARASPSRRRRPCRRSPRRSAGRTRSSSSTSGANSRRCWRWRCCCRWSAAPRSSRTCARVPMVSKR